MVIALSHFLMKRDKDFIKVIHLCLPECFCNISSLSKPNVTSDSCNQSGCSLLEISGNVLIPEIKL